MTPADWLQLIAERAKELRAAGVRKLEMPELRLELDAWEPEPMAARDSDKDRTVVIEGDSDPFNDPATFGRRDGSLPGFKANSRLGDDAT